MKNKPDNPYTVKTLNKSPSNLFMKTNNNATLSSSNKNGLHTEIVARVTIENKNPIIKKNPILYSETEENDNPLL